MLFRVFECPIFRKIKNYTIRTNGNRKVQTAFRFDAELLDLIREKAHAQRRSLNNYLEILMLRDVGNIPNAETKRAIQEARDGNVEEIDDLDSGLEKL